MPRNPQKSPKNSPAVLNSAQRISASRKTPVHTPPHQTAFAEVAALVESARHRAHRAANTALIDLYWAIGEYISRKVKVEQWGKSVVRQLAEYLAHKIPGKRGFSASNLWRMMQFYDVYHEYQILATMLRELPWSSHMHILGRCKSMEEREFYLRMCIREKWQVRELERQIDSRLFLRVIESPVKASASLKQTHPAAGQIFRDAYLLDFLDLPAKHSENDLQKGLVNDLKAFLAELGRDFCYVGEQYPLQVGEDDFHLDLLFYHRALQCLVAIELKVGNFKPEHLGQLSFYLEALDRDVRKAHEKPSVGILLCAGKNAEVVEYALSRTLSPTLVSEYQTCLPDRELLQRKLAELYACEVERARSGAVAE